MDSKNTCHTLLAHRDNIPAKEDENCPDGRRVTQTPFIAGPLAKMLELNYLASHRNLKNFK